jgi:hypothetical protein
MRVTQDNETAEMLEALDRKVDLLSADIASIKRHFQWEKVWGMVRLAVIAIPIVWASISIFPIVHRIYGQTQEIIRQADLVLKSAR